jgi:hypothetical protein
VDRLSGCAVPDDGRLALIRDADGRNRFGGDAGFLEYFVCDSALAFPDGRGVVLDPARLGVDLGEFLLADPDDVAVVVEQDRAHGSGSRVKGHHMGRIHQSAVLSP